MAQTAPPSSSVSTISIVIKFIKFKFKTLRKDQKKLIGVFCLNITKFYIQFVIAKNIVSVYFRLDSYFDNYSRRIYSLGDLLGQVGGLYSSILIIGALFVGIFSERLFVSSILRKIYQIDKMRDDEIWRAYANSKGKISTQQIPSKFEHGKIIHYQNHL